MSYYRLELHCPTCPPGTPVEHQTGSRPTTRELRTVVRCTTCRNLYVINVQLLGCHDVDPGQPHGRNLPLEHGSERGYQQHRRTDGRHRRTHPDPCDPCIDAHAANKRRLIPA